MAGKEQIIQEKSSYDVRKKLHISFDMDQALDST